MKLFSMTAAAAFAAGAAFTMTAPAHAADEIWIEDNMPAALEKAKAEGKDIMIDFTGTDWCIWCIRLKDEVFSKSEFKETVPDDFVLVMLDFPNNKPQTDEVKAHNQEWQQKFKVQGFPTIVLTDSEGQEYARTGYRPDGPTPYIEHLNELRAGKAQRDEALKAAKSAEGIEKARHLDKAMSIEGIVVPDTEGKMKQIIALDSDNSAGLKEKYEPLLKQLQLDNAFAEVENLFRARQTEQALAKLDQIESNYELDDDAYMNLIGMRVSLLINTGNTDAAEKAIESAMNREGLDAQQRQMIAVNRINIVFPTGDNAKIRQVAQEIVDIAPDTELAAQIKNFLAGLPSEDEG